MSSIARSAFLSALFVSCISSAPAALHAQTPEQARIAQAIDDSRLVTLHGNTHPFAQPRFDRGPAPDEMPAGRMLLVLRRSAEQDAALDTFLKSLQDANSPAYRRWLTPAEFGRRFGVSDADLAIIRAWLRSRGFTVNRVAASRVAIEFTGSVGQVREAFHAPIHKYVVDGQEHWANAGDPQIPAALAPVVAGVAQLNDFVPRANFARAPSGIYNSQTGRIEPSYTLGNSTNGYTIYVGPADAATIYDIPNRLNANLKGAIYDGAGVTVGIAGDSNIDVKQNANYRATFGLPAQATQVVVDGNDPGENGDAIEAYLDTQVSGAIAPNANVILYTAANTYLQSGLFLAIVRALDDNQADILNVSFGGCELHQGVAGNEFVNQLWQQAAAQGISVTVSSGDSGSAGCDNPNTEWEATAGLAVNALASTPYNIAVGGTDFDTLFSEFPSSFTDFVDVTNTLPYHRSALGYIPERPWNDSTFQNYNTTISENLPWGATQYHSLANISATGGGASACTNQASGRCVSGYAQPSWQAGMATDARGRNVPDVSFLAGNGLYGAAWGLCTDLEYDTATGKPVADCAGTPATGNKFNLTGVGGTSAAAPFFAGVLALIDQKTGGRAGQAAPVLYNLARSSESAFHVVSTGNNSVSCKENSSACAPNMNDYYFMTGFNSAAPYSEAAGLGSVDAAALLDAWSGVRLAPTTAKLIADGGAAALHLTHGAKANLAVEVTSHNGTPDGSVALVDNLSAATQPDSGSIGTLTLSGGSAKAAIGSLPGGSYRLSAHYGGSSAFAASDSNSIPVTVEPEDSTTNLTVRGFYDPATGKATTEPHYGFIAVIDAQPYGKSSSLANPNAPAAGTVRFLSGSTALATVPIASNGVAELFTTTLPAGSYPITANYSGDASFKASTSTSQGFNILPAATTITGPELNIDAGGIDAGQQVTFSASLKSLDSDGAAPTGAVTFWNGAQKLGSAPIKGVAGAPGVPASGSVSWTTTLLPAGNLTVFARYEGDANYATSPKAGGLELVVSSASPSVVGSNYPHAFKVNQSFSVNVLVRGVEGLPMPTGTAYITAEGTNTPVGYTSPSVILSRGSAVVTVPENSLNLGYQTLTVNYSGDEYYNSWSTAIVVDVEPTGTTQPTITFSPASGATISKFPFNLTVSISGRAGAPVPSGSVSLNTPEQSYAAKELSGGQATLSIASLPPGYPTKVTFSYTGDSNFASKSGTIDFTVPAVNLSPLLLVYQGSRTIDRNQALAVEVVVKEPPLPTPTGSVYFTLGSYKSQPEKLLNGFATFLVPQNSLPVGLPRGLVYYSGDLLYAPTTQDIDVNVQPAGPAFNISAANVTVSPGATSGNASTITVAPSDGFKGSVIFSTSACHAEDPAVLTQPKVLIGGPLVISGTASQTVSAQVITTPSTEPASYLCWIYAGSGSIKSTALLKISVK